MKVFFSWSGARSLAVAEALSPWIRRLIQAIEPWSSTEIPKGSRWGAEVTSRLEETRVGIICLTRENLKSPWILFEAGALSKTKNGIVATFLLDIRGTDVEQPLAQFQHTTAKEADVRELVRTLNKEVAQDGGRALNQGDLDVLFDQTWPELKAKFDQIPASNEPAAPVRSDSEIVREVLEVVRNLQTAASRSSGPAEATLDDGIDYLYGVTFPKDADERLVGRFIFASSTLGWESRYEDPADQSALVVITHRPSQRVMQNLLNKIGLAGANIKLVTARER